MYRRHHVELLLRCRYRRRSASIFTICLFRFGEIGLRLLDRVLLIGVELDDLVVLLDGGAGLQQLDDAQRAAGGGAIRFTVRPARARPWRTP